MIWVRSGWVSQPLPTFPGRSNPAELATATSYAVRGSATSPASCALIQTPRDPLIVYGTIITWANDPGPTPQPKAVAKDPFPQLTVYAAETLHAIEAHDAGWQRLGREYKDVPSRRRGSQHDAGQAAIAYEGLLDEAREALACSGMQHVTRTLD